jgi:ParB/RepB/Spo0J family partition protein
VPAKSAAIARSYVPRARSQPQVAALVEAARSSSRLHGIPIDCIEPNPRNPRATFTEQAINELAQSLREDGQLQPVLVRRLDPDPRDGGQAKFELIAGERRWRASKRAGLETIQAAIWDVSDEESLRLALIENWHRAGLTPAEHVAGLEALAEAAGQIGVRELARKLHLAPSTISERLKVRRDPLVWPALEEGRIPLGHAFRLRRAPALARSHLVGRVVAERPSREMLEEWIEDARGEQRRAGAAASLATAAGMSKGVRQSNTLDQAARGQMYLDSLADGLGEPGREIAQAVHARLSELLLSEPAASQNMVSIKRRGTKTA